MTVDEVRALIKTLRQEIDRDKFHAEVNGDSGNYQGGQLKALDKLLDRLQMMSQPYNREAEG